MIAFLLGFALGMATVLVIAAIAIVNEGARHDN